MAGKFVPVEDTVQGFKEILEGKHDDMSENSVYMVGSIAEALEKEAKAAA
jgi:F-type H+-transporting ATPase subunit beta